MNFAETFRLVVSFCLGSIVTILILYRFISVVFPADYISHRFILDTFGGSNFVSFNLVTEITEISENVGPKAV